MNTSSYGPRGNGAEIAYAIVDSALGRLLVASTERGICFAAMGEADRMLVAELHSDYPRATIRVADPNRRDHERIGLWADALADYIAGRSTMPAPPMDIRGTPFQVAVLDQSWRLSMGTGAQAKVARDGIANEPRN